MKVLISLFFLGLHCTLYGQYKIYTDLTNLFGQQVIETHDGGLLLVAGEDCYTPGSITIEGCMYALHLVRTDNDGDTLWTRRIGFSGSLIHIQENSDGSFTLFGDVMDNYQCDDILIGLSGFSVIRILNLTSTGLLQSSYQFPPTCELILKDVMPVNDSLFVALGIYSKPIYWPSQDEGRLMIMNKYGQIKNERILPGLDWERGWLLPVEADIFELLYIDALNVIHLVRYNVELAEVSHFENADDYHTCYDSDYQIKVIKAENDGILITCREESGNDYLFHISQFDPQLQLQTTHTNTFNAITNMVELPDGRFLVGVSGINDPINFVNTTLVYLDPEGSFQSSIVVEAPERERPTQILLTSIDSIVVAGNINCCNMHDTIGPGKSFLLFGPFMTTSTTYLSGNPHFFVFPNPSSEEIFVKPSELGDSMPDAIVIYDPLGRLVINQAIDEKTPSIRISNLNSGVYFYVLKLENVPLAVGKFVKR